MPALSLVVPRRSPAHPRCIRTCRILSDVRDDIAESFHPISAAAASVSEASGHPLAKVAARKGQPVTPYQRKRCFSVPQFVCSTGVGANDRFTSAIKSA